LGTLLQDIRYGVRMLAKNPGFALIAILTLALGIGANTAIFSVINATLLARPGFRQPERLVMVWEKNQQLSRDRNVVSPGNFLHWRQENSAFDRMAALYDFDTNLTGQGNPERVPAQAITPEMMSLLGVPARLGRTFVQQDGETGKDNVVLLSYGLWQRRFGSDPNIVGKTVRLDDQALTVIGVMPPGFQFFVAEWSLTGEQAELWEPITFNEANWTPIGRYMTVVARLKPTVTLAQAQSEMDGIAEGLEKQYPQADHGWGVKLVPLHEQLTGGIRATLFILLGAVGFVLLIACANVANLQLARATSRHRELAVRTALGASRGRLARQLLTESLIVALLGGVAGGLLAQGMVAVLLAVAPRSMTELQSVHIDLRTLAFTAGLVLLTGILFGLAPTVTVLRRDVNESLKEEGRSGGSSARGGRLRKVLVVAETALALVLLIGAGLLIRSFARLQAVSPGFDPQSLFTAKVELPAQKYPKAEQRVAFFAELLERVRALPGVTAATGSASLPFTGLGPAAGYSVAGRPAPLAIADLPVADVRVVDPDYFRTMRIPLIRGRFFNEREETQESHMVIISETMARESWPNADPLGQQVVIRMKETDVPSTIVGVVGDVKEAGLDSTPRATAYWPHPELPYPFMTLAVRTSGDPLRMAGAIQQQVQGLDRDLPLSKVRTMDQWMADSAAQARFSTLLLMAFAGVAMLLAVVGIYGVTSYAVTQRTREIGIRMALGAQVADVLRLVGREGLSLALAGIAAGILLSFGLTRLLRSLLFEVSALDPWTFAGVAVILSVAAIVASLIPARRAMRVDPMVALRYE
jgi:putative ABC transport system permease protein